MRQETREETTVNIHAPIEGSVAGRDIRWSVHGDLVIQQVVNVGPMGRLYGHMPVGSHHTLREVHESGIVTARDLLHACRCAALVWRGRALTRNHVVADRFLFGAIMLPLLILLAIFVGAWPRAAALGSNGPLLLMGFSVATTCVLIWSVYQFVWPQVIAARVTQFLQRTGRTGFEACEKG